MCEAILMDSFMIFITPTPLLNTATIYKFKTIDPDEGLPRKKNSSILCVYSEDLTKVTNLMRPYSFTH